MSNLKALACLVGACGYAVQEDILTEAEIDGLIDAIERQQVGESLPRNGRIFAIRNLSDLPEIIDTPHG